MQALMKGLNAGTKTARTAAKDTVTFGVVWSAKPQCFVDLFVGWAGGGYEHTHNQDLPLEGYRPERNDLIGHQA